MTSTLETLPDEILLLIFRYSGCVYSIFSSFIGLNHRFNRILCDRRLHLFTDFLQISPRHTDFNEYYNSPLFCQLVQQFYSLQSPDQIVRLQQYFQDLISFHIREKYRRIEEELRHGREEFQAIRASLSDTTISVRDDLLKRHFPWQKSSPKGIGNLPLLESFVYGTGARLTCKDNELGEFNLASAVNQYLLGYDCHQESSRSDLRSTLKLFKALLISNSKLLHNREYVGNGGACVHFFLAHWIYRLRDFYCSTKFQSINRSRFDTIVELFLFIIHCLRQTNDGAEKIQDCLFHALEWVTSIDFDIDQQIFVHTTQLEVLKILWHEVRQGEIQWDDNFICRWQNALRNLVTHKRMDMLLFVSHQPILLQNVFNRIENYRKSIDKMTGNRDGRRFFQELIHSEQRPEWVTSNELLFALLKKKECQILKPLIRLEPALARQLDPNGNDPLLYVCLEVRGCRQRLVEFLLAIGCDWQHRNHRDEHFLQVLQYANNRDLLKNLLELEVIIRDNLTEQLHIASTKKESNSSSDLAH